MYGNGRGVACSFHLSSLGRGGNKGTKIPLLIKGTLSGDLHKSKQDQSEIYKVTFSWNSLSVYSVVYTETKAVFLIPELGLCTVTVISYYFCPLRFFLSSIIDRAMNAINQRNNKEKI